jgi:hypothetical protein
MILIKIRTKAKEGIEQRMGRNLAKARVTKGATSHRTAVGAAEAAPQGF